MSDHVHICCFSVGLDELTRRKQRSAIAVARVLAEAGKFSVFEVTANEDIARTVTKLGGKLGWFTYEPQGFPWTKVTLTDDGRRALKVLR